MAVAKERGTRRAQLLDAARRAVTTYGPGVRLRQVADEAGLTSGAVLYHFPDLQTLLLEANRAGTERFYEQRVRASEGIADPARRLVEMVRSGIPRDSGDEGVRLLCALGGAASRHSTYAVLLTSLYDRQVSMYQTAIETGEALGVFTLAQPSTSTARNLVALEDAYGYRIVAGHPTITHAVATELVLDHARLAVGHPLETDDSRATDLARPRRKEAHD